jgi:hypothetical protein
MIQVSKLVESLVAVKTELTTYDTLENAAQASGATAEKDRAAADAQKAIVNTKVAELQSLLAQIEPLKPAPDADSATTVDAKLNI